MNEISQFLTWYGCLAIFVAVLAEQNGIPVPAAPVLLAAGALAAYGHFNLVSAIAWTTVACILADALWFCAGHHGKARVEPLFERCRGPLRNRPSTTGVRAHLHALQVLTTAKFLPLGTLVPLRAGTLDISLLRFLLLDVPGALIYASTYLLLGFYFHHQLNQLTAIIRELGIAGLLLVLLLAGIYIALGVIRRRKPESISPKNTRTAAVAARRIPSKPLHSNRAI